MRQGFVFSIIVSTIFCAQAFGYDWSTNPGDGSPDNPYQISTPEQLMSIGSNVDLLDKHFILMNDIVFDPNSNSEHVFTEALIAPDLNIERGYDGNPFIGSFDGNNYNIQNLTIDSRVANSEYIGLFGLIKDAGEVKNLNFENVKINGGEFSYYVSILTGGSTGSIISCHASGQVEGINDHIGGAVGGLVGSNGGMIQLCHVRGAVRGIDPYVGGLCGINGGALVDCYTVGVVSGTSRVGGLCGYNYSTGNIENCYSSSEVNGTDSDVGGLCGQNGGNIINSYTIGIVYGPHVNTGGLCGSNTYGDIISCYATGDVNGREYVGGLCGRNTGRVMASFATGQVKGSYDEVGGLCGRNLSFIKNCYSTGEVSGRWYVGGFCGYNSNTLINCYSSGVVFGRNFFGGLCGRNIGIITSNYFLNTAGPNNQNGIPLTNIQMKCSESFVNWDFGDIWFIRPDNYPQLWWENHLPVANAGDDQKIYAWIDGYAMVSLDGTGSYDEDGDELTYSWYDGNDLFATGAEPNVVLPVGEHVIDLIVNDGIADSEPDTCVITVVDPFEALAGDITELVEDVGLANSLLAKVDAARKIIEDGNENNDGAAAGSLEAFINAVNAQRGKKISEEDADSLIAVAEHIITML